MLIAARPKSGHKKLMLLLLFSFVVIINLYYPIHSSSFFSHFQCLTTLVFHVASNLNKQQALSE